MQQTASRQMKLLLFPSFSGAHVAGWRHPHADPGRMHNIGFHRHLAQTAERGLFDALFLADAQGFRTIVGRDAFSRHEAARLEPISLLSALAMLTERLGLIATVSTSYNEPYSAARRLASLDHISSGRAGWNVVTSTTRNEARNFGRDAHFGHAERYARAAEFIDVVKGLWDSWDEDAILADQQSGRFLDPDKVHALDHAGEFFRVAGPLTTLRPPQGHPVIVQAGTSAAGRALAAATAELVFTSSPGLARAQQTYRELKAAVTAAGRDAGACLIIPAIQPIIAASRDEADAIAAELDALIHPDVALSMLELALGGHVDLSCYDRDGPLPPVPPTQASQSTQARVIEMASNEQLTIGQLAQRVASSRTSAPIVGTPAMVADTLEHWFRNGAADGFALAAPYLPGGLEAFVDHVVPELQRRGIFRTHYEGRTLRENLGLTRPPSRYQLNPDCHREPEIWHRDQPPQAAGQR